MKLLHFVDGVDGGRRIFATSISDQNGMREADPQIQPKVGVLYTRNLSLATASSASCCRPASAPLSTFTPPLAAAAAGAGVRRRPRRRRAARRCRPRARRTRTPPLPLDGFCFFDGGELVERQVQAFLTSRRRPPPRRRAARRRRPWRRWTPPPPRPSPPSSAARARATARSAPSCAVELDVHLVLVVVTILPLGALPRREVRVVDLLSSASHVPSSRRTIGTSPSAEPSDDDAATGTGVDFGMRAMPSDVTSNFLMALIGSAWRIARAAEGVAPRCAAESTDRRWR